MHTLRYSHEDPETGVQTLYYMHYNSDFSGEIKLFRQVLKGTETEVPRSEPVEADPILIQALICLGRKQASMELMAFAEDLL